MKCGTYRVTRQLDAEYSRQKKKKFASSALMVWKVYLADHRRVGHFISTTTPFYMCFREK